MKRNLIYNYLSGWLSVQAEGPFTERLINICMHRKMAIWDIKRCGSERIIFKASIEAFKQIRTPARRTKSRVRITKRHGLPFLLRRYRNRKFVVGGIIVLAVMLWYSSTHIMGITVFGNQRIDTQTVLAKLEECGLSLGTRTSLIEPDVIRNKMMTAVDDLAWVGVNANGSRVYIEIVERIEKEAGIENDDTAYNLVASKDGEIEKVEVREGQTVVKVGSGVREGDMLVSGIVDSGVRGFRYVKARGEVFAKTRYSKTGVYPLKYTESIKTGEIKKRYTLSVLGYDLPLFFKRSAPYNEFSYKEEQKEYSVPIDIVPSLFVKKEEYSEEIKEEKQRTAAEAVETGIAELSDGLKKELPEGAEIIEQIESYTLNEHGEVEVTVELLCRENIAKTEVIEKMMPEE